MQANVEAIHETRLSPPVRGFLHRPATASGNALVLTHGAGSDCNAPLLVALAEVFAEHGWTVLRCDLPYRQLRPHGPPRGSGAEDRAGLRRAVELCRKLAPGLTFLGGMSYGGRQASVLCAEDPAICDGLLLLSYPLHPPGKPEQLRTAHLPSIKVPALFVSGSKDPFGTPSELQTALQLLPVPPMSLVIADAGHDLGYGRRAGAKTGTLPSDILNEMRRLVTKVH